MFAGEPLIFGIVANSSLFDGLDPAICRRLAAGSELRDYPAGDFIFREGEPGTGLQWVVSGKVKLLLRTVNGNEKVFDLIGPGASFGEPSMYTNVPQLVTAKAIEAAQVLHIPGQTLHREILETPEFALRVIRILSQRIHRCTYDLKSYFLLSGTQRVISYLLREVPIEAHGLQQVEVALPVRKRIIASLLNLTQEHFSRILHELAAAALIKVDGQRVFIRDIARLRVWAVK